MFSWTIPITDHRVQVRSTTAEDGDFAIPSPAIASPAGSLWTPVATPQALPQVEPRDTPLDQRRRSIIDRPWTWLRQVHGAEVVIVRSPGDGAGATADGALTTISEAPIAVTTADCSPVVLVSTIGVAVVHAGWRGAHQGIIEAAGEQLLAEGGVPVASLLGPCIGVDHYEFGRDELDHVAAIYGGSVRGVTNHGTPALDMAAVVRSACERSGWPAPTPTACTGGEQFFSHRVRGDRGRQTTVAWIEASCIEASCIEAAS